LLIPGSTPPAARVEIAVELDDITDKLGAVGRRVVYVPDDFVGLDIARVRGRQNYAVVTCDAGEASDEWGSLEVGL
jgi:hypothetical protein